MDAEERCSVSNVVLLLVGRVEPIKERGVRSVPVEPFRAPFEDHDGLSVLAMDDDRVVVREVSDPARPFPAAAVKVAVGPDSPTSA
jgi:hypothetical protein